MKRLSALILLLCWVVFLQAKPVSIETAKTVAANFLLQYQLVSKNVELTSAYQQDKASLQQYYIFNFNQTGFIIIAGDDAVTPVLGYSTESVFGEVPLPPSFSAMLASYSNQIEYIRSHSLQSDATVAQEWVKYSYNTGSTKSISSEQLLYCEWDQGAPYNALCPQDPAGPGGRVYTGCVATMMAMTMYYYRYPEQPSGTHGYMSDYGYLSVDLSQSHYNYEQMPFRLNMANFDAAKLQYDCGVTVDMMYSPNGSGAFMDDALNSMINHFGYNPTATLEYKSSYSESDWKNLLKAQLDAGHPLPYAGYDPSGGHAFVCDGYNSTDMFHFNWGWSGSYNGYYIISNLNPGYNFSSGQQAFINCYPAAVSYPLSCGNYTMTSRCGSLEVGHGLSGYLNNQNCSWLIAPTDSVDFITLDFRFLSTESGNDVVTVYQGENTSAPVFATFSGNNTPSDLTIPGNRVFITFLSNSSITANGFHADYFCNTPQYCSIMNIRTDPAGSINDGSHTYNYNNNSVCRWKIEPAGAQGIMIDFVEFNLEDNLDLLEFYFFPSYTLVESLSGQVIPQSFYINSPVTMVIFKSNESNPDAGFTFNYHAVSTGVDEMPGSYMFLYENSNKYPVLSISGFPFGVYDLVMTDITGRVIFDTEYDVTGSKAEIEIPFLPENEGLYFISLRNNDLYKTVKYFAR